MEKLEKVARIVLMRKIKKKRSPERHRLIWEENKEVGWAAVDRFDVAHNREGCGLL